MSLPPREALLDIDWLSRIHAAEGFDALLRYVRNGAEAPPVAILSESMARFYFRNDNPVGRRISLRQFNGKWAPPMEIVGVASDSRRSD